MLAVLLAGAVTQPIVGVLSDQTTHKWGRRRPWMASGAVMLGVAYLVLSNAFTLGGWLGGAISSSRSYD